MTTGVYNVLYCIHCTIILASTDDHWGLPYCILLLDWSVGMLSAYTMNSYLHKAAHTINTLRLNI